MQIYYGSGCATLSSGTSGYISLSHMNQSSVYTPQAPKALGDATISKLSLYCSSNTLNADVTARFYKNTAQGNGVVVLSAGATGLVQDASGSDTVADGDTYTIQHTRPASTGSYTMTQQYALVDATTWAFSNASQSSPNNQIKYAAPQGSYDSGLTESAVQMKVQHAYTLSRLTVFVYYYFYWAAGMAFRLRKNTANGNQVILPTATGWYEDASGTDDVVAGDLIDYKIDCSGGNSFGPACQMLLSSSYPHEIRNGSGVSATSSTKCMFQGVSGAHTALGYTVTELSRVVYETTAYGKLTVQYNNGRDSGSMTVTLDKNDTPDSTVQVTGASGTSGWLEDLTGEVSYTAVTDKALYAVVPGGSSGTLTIYSLQAGVTAEFPTVTAYSPTANSGNWTNPTNAYASGGGVATHDGGDTVETKSPTANTGSAWTNPTNAYADGTNYANITAGNPSGSNVWKTYGFSLTGKRITKVRVRVDGLSEGVAASPTTVTRQPTRDANINPSGSYTTEPLWSKVNDNDDATYMTGSANTGGRAMFGFDAFAIPAGSTSISINIHYRHRSATTGTAYAHSSCLYSGGNYYGRGQTAGWDAGHASGPASGSPIEDHNNSSATNPATGSNWTVAEVNALGQFGISSDDFNPDARFFQVDISCTYTPPTEYNDQIKVDVSWDNGSSWSSTQIATMTNAEATTWLDFTAATTWDATKIGDANFQVRALAQLVGNAEVVRLDWIPVEVTYTDESLWTHVYDDYGISITGTVTKVEVGIKAFADSSEKISLEVSANHGSSWSSVQTSAALPASLPGGVTWFDFTAHTTWTSTNLANGSFQVRITYKDNGAFGTISLDWLPARVTYTPASGEEKGPVNSAISIGFKATATQGAWGRTRTSTVLIGNKVTATRSLAATRSSTVLLGTKTTGSRLKAAARASIVSIGVSTAASLTGLTTASPITDVQTTVPTSSNPVGIVEADDIVQIEAEDMFVITSSSNPGLTVVRGYNGTTPVAHDAGVSIYLKKAHKVKGINRASSASIGVKVTASRIAGYIRSSVVLIGTKPTASRVAGVTKNAAVSLGVKVSASRIFGSLRASAVSLGVVVSATRTKAAARQSALILGVKTTASRSVGYHKASSVLLGVRASATRRLDTVRSSSVAVGVKTTASVLKSVVRAALVSIGVRVSASRTYSAVRSSAVAIAVKTTATRLAGYVRSAAVSIGEVVSATWEKATGGGSQNVFRASAVSIGVAVSAMRRVDWNRPSLALIGVSVSASRAVGKMVASSVVIGVMTTATKSVGVVRTALVSIGEKVSASRTVGYSRTAVVRLGVAVTASRAVAYTRASATSIGVKVSAWIQYGRIYVAAVAIGVAVTASRVAGYSRAGSILIGVRTTASRSVSWTRSSIVAIGIKTTAELTLDRILKIVSAIGEVFGFTSRAIPGVEISSAAAAALGIETAAEPAIEMESSADSGVSIESAITEG